MTPQQIAADIERGLQIRQEIKALETELKAIEDRLEAAGLDGEHVPLEDATREGKQYLARGASQIVPVRFESDQIVGSFLPDSIMHRNALAIVGTQLPKFFKDVRKFERVPKDGNDFRKLGRKLLDPDQFARLVRAVTACDKHGIPKSKTVISWDHAQAITQFSTI
jgi:hypothetical protein